MDDFDENEGEGLDPKRATRYLSMIKDPAERERFKGIANRNVKNASQKRALLSGGAAPKKPTLAASDMTMLLGVAAMLDLTDMCLNAIPVAGGFLATLCVATPGTCIMWFMYKRRGIDMNSNKMMFRFVSAAALAFIPVVNMLPDFILNVTLIIGAMKAEEASKHII
jgi:hypothetical protein